MWGLMWPLFSTLIFPRVRFISKIDYDVSFASLLYETFVEQDGSHKVGEYVCTVGGFYIMSWDSCKNSQSKNFFKKKRKIKRIVVCFGKFL